MPIEDEFGEWKDVVRDMVTPAWVKKLTTVIKAGNTTPPSSVMFRALKMTPPGRVRVVLLGQDPYPQKGIADGLAFSTQSLTRPVSLDRMLWEARAWAGTKTISHEDMFFWNDLSYWAHQGVLLINSSFSTEINQPGAHSELWEPFTKAILNSLGKDVIVCTLGKTAQKLCRDVKGKKIFVPHPAARGGEFKGCDMFRQIDKELSGIKINWSLPHYGSDQTYGVVCNTRLASISKAYMKHLGSAAFLKKLHDVKVGDLAPINQESISWKGKPMQPGYLNGDHVYDFIQQLVSGAQFFTDDNIITLQ